MISLLLAPGLTIEAAQVTQIIKKVAWNPEAAPHLVSTIQFDPQDQSKFSTNLSIPEQCRFGIEQLGSCSEGLCRIVWIWEEEPGMEDVVAVAALQRSCARQFEATSLIILRAGTVKKSKVEIITMAQSYFLDKFLSSTNLGLKDLVALGRCEGHGPLAILLDTKEAKGLEEALRRQTRWSLDRPFQVEFKDIFPMAVFAKGMRLLMSLASGESLSDGGDGLVTGHYATMINERWFALIHVKDGKNVFLFVAPQPFSPLCHQIALSNRKVRERRPSTPPPPAPSQINALPGIRLRSNNSFTDNTISLAGWTASQDPNYSSPKPSTRQQATNDQLKESNKHMLKKLLLLSLRHVGVEKSHPEFMSIWKHLYCGCLFALRRDLAHDHIDQASMLAVIKNNINFLNISR